MYNIMKYTKLPCGWLHQLNLFILTSYHEIPGIVKRECVPQANLGARASHVLVVIYLEETQLLNTCSDTVFTPVVLI